MKRMKCFSPQLIVRAASLLPMLYSPRELGQELNLPSSTVRAWILRGMPHQRDEKGLLWIHGRAFAQWVSQVYQARPHIRLAHDEAFCLYCKRAVKIQNPTITRRGKQVLWRGHCPTCNHPINRGGRNDSSS